MHSLLLIEDSSELRDLVGFCLDTWTVREASSRLEAMGLLGDSKPDLILLDSQLDDGPSQLWFSQLRAAFDGPIVWFSGHAPGPELSGQIAGQILKPFDPTQLANQLEHIWGAHGSAGSRPKVG